MHSCQPNCFYCSQIVMFLGKKSKTRIWQLRKTYWCLIPEHACLKQQAGPWMRWNWASKVLLMLLHRNGYISSKFSLPFDLTTFLPAKLSPECSLHQHLQCNVQTLPEFSNLSNQSFPACKAGEMSPSSSSRLGGLTESGCCCIFVLLTLISCSFCLSIWTGKA